MSATCRCRKMYRLKHNSILKLLAITLFLTLFTFKVRDGLSIITIHATYQIQTKYFHR